MDEILEEQNFPYINMSLDEARSIRYLIRNLPELDGKALVSLSLVKKENKVHLNGLIKGVKENESIDGTIFMDKYWWEIYSMFENVLTHKDYYSIDKIIFAKDCIKIESNAEDREILDKDIPYLENSYSFHNYKVK